MKDSNQRHVNGSPDTNGKPLATHDLICLSHLRWDFVFQRPQHLMTRFAKHRRVFFFEEPIFEESRDASLNINRRDNGLHVVTPTLPTGLAPADVVRIQRDLLDLLLESEGIEDFTAWYYTPMALSFSKHLKPKRTIYDCMDELSAFKNAPIELLNFERDLVKRSHHVFTGGVSLYEAKRHLHPNVHAFPSSIDFKHFSQARAGGSEPQDQKAIPHPRVGFFGVIDERFDIELMKDVSSKLPNTHFVLIGPVVKIDPASLPEAPNIHYLGMKSYQELPSYIAHWDAAMMPFALNESTRFISPTKTPEFLAAGRAVVSTPIRDVVCPYGELGLVRIAETADGFANALRDGTTDRKDPEWLRKVDHFLADLSWDHTWSRMAALEFAAKQSPHQMDAVTTPLRDTADRLSEA